MSMKREVHSQAKLQLNLCWGDDLEINIKENQSGMEEKFSSRASISDNEASQAKNAQLKLVSTFVHLVNKLGRHSDPCNPLFLPKPTIAN